MMKRILVYENRKVDPSYFDASTPELEAGAYLLLFKQLDETWNVYADLSEEMPLAVVPEGHVPGCKCVLCEEVPKHNAKRENKEKTRLSQLKLYERALAGDALAARDLLKKRNGYQYEGFTFATVESRSVDFRATPPPPSTAKT